MVLLGPGPEVPTDLPGVGGPLPDRLELGWLRAAFAAGMRVADLVELLLPRLADSHPAVWISRLSAEALRRTARELDAVPPSQRRDLALFGVPFAVKDNIDVAGLATTAGCPAFAYHPDTDAAVVARLRAAGALVVGKTNLDQFATGLVGTRSPYGACESVYGDGLISGGSSSGSAVAVADGQVAFALGTDTAGSGRVPAALNGLVGLKPTKGLLSIRGVVPACRSLDCVSIFAGSVADASLVLAVTAGFDAADPWSRRRPAMPRSARSRPRVGLPGLTSEDMFGDTRMLAAFTRAASGLGSGADVVPVSIGALREAGDLLYAGPWVAERLADLEPFLRGNPHDVLPLTRRILEQGYQHSAADAFRAMHRLRELQAELARLWADVDAILLPTVGTTFTLEDVRAEPLACNTALGRFTQFANLLDCSVLTVPTGFTSDGRPASVSLVGPAFSEQLLAVLASGDGAAESPPGSTALAVVGLHLSGEQRNGELVQAGAALRETTTTSPDYRLFRLPHRTPSLPALLRVRSGGAPVEVEIWDVPVGSIGDLLVALPAPLGLGSVGLADGRTVLGFLCESYATADGDDITSFGGWRAAQSSLQRSTTP